MGEVGGDGLPMFLLPPCLLDGECVLGGDAKVTAISELVFANVIAPPIDLSL